MESADVLMEEKKLMTEAKYRNYMSNIDKALRNFEYSSEWADLISALGKLSKAISSNTQYQVIPRRIKISKRLAQCMHPALPSGVHLKALETYAVIFGKTGPERLATELFIYSSGLFPLLGYAAMNVRPALLGIYETYFVPLGEKLRPALSGFLSGVLPGYESGLDHFERTSSLLTQVCTAVNPTHFYTVLWECVATNASVRLPAISYLLEHFNKKMSMKEQIYVMGHNRDTMMSGLCACLNDSVILVQRNTLEFLLLGFPMHTKLLPDSDLAKLVTNGLNTILRRDMSLNRRLYSWLLGSEILKNSPTYEAEQTLPTSAADGAAKEPPAATYFEKHSRHVVIEAIITTLKFSLECSPVDLKPYRIMVSLLDKAEIGSAVLDYVLCDIIRTMSLSIGNVEVIKSSNLLFATFDPAYIWSFMTTMFERSCKKIKNISNSEASNRNSRNSSSQSIYCNDQRFQCIVGSGDPSLVEICYLTEFLLETISLEMYNETTRIYLPKVFLAITQMLTVHQKNLTDDEVSASLKLCLKIVSRVQPMITSPVKIMPRSQIQSSNDEKSSVANTAKPQPLSALVGANALEKSKSDSKLDQFANQDNHLNSLALNRDEDYIRRSNSNQNMERKSPTKKKKAKSFSKLSELDKEICPDTGQLIDPRQSSSDLDTPMSIKKIKAKGKQTQNRLRMSPRKSRPQELVLPEDKNASSIDYVHSANESQIETPVGDYQDEEPKSAPLEHLSKQQLEGFIFNYHDGFNEEDLQHTKDNYMTTSSILEKCIKQYEIFFEIYLSNKVLNIPSSTEVKPQPDSKCPITVQVQKHDCLADAGKIPNVENIFKHEQVYEDTNPCRILDIDNLFETLKIHVTNRSKKLHSLLNRSLVDGQSENTDEGSDDDESSYNMDDVTNNRLQALLGLQLTPSLRLAVKLSVNLLVEMSTFPNCNKNITLEKTEKELPSWLKVLSTIACYTQSDKELQLSAVTTLFDLISLLKSQIEHTTSPGVTFVVMLPLLKFGHVHYIERRTRVFQLLASNLWDCLGEQNVDNGQVCALLYQLHNCLESGLVERIIDNRMYAKTMQQHFTAAYETVDSNTSLRKRETSSSAWGSYAFDRAVDVHMMCVAPTFLVKRSTIERLSESESISFKKYELLWHLGRDKQQTRGFEKIQFKVLDTLALPPYMSVRTCVTKWLQSALLRGDLTRLVKPLYKILLASNTKRVGIVHLHLLRKGSEENSSETAKAGNICSQSENNNSADIDSSVEADVYAVSSEYGNIRYITDTANHNKKRSPIRSIQKKIFGVSLSSKNKTSNFVSDQTPSSSSPLTGTVDVAIGSTTTIGLIVNPLENSLDFDDDHEPEEIKSNKKVCQEDYDAEDMDEGDDNDDPVFDQDYTDESDSSMYDSESEQRETSAEKDDSITTQSCAYDSKSHLKRYVGHTESVTEILSQHERTKNRKTYHLTREKTPGETSLTSTTTEEHAPLSLELEQDGDGDVHPAEEYFDSKSEERQVESFVEDLIGRVKDASIASKRKKKSKNHVKKLRSKKAQRPLSGQEKMDKKRMSCISKISTDSNNSFTTGEIAKENEDEEDSVSSKFINIEEKRKTLNLETSKSLTKEWELTPETLEKSKQNLEILRQSASSQLLKHDMSSKRSSTKSCLSYDGSKRSQSEKLVPVFQNHMLVYMNVYDTKQTLYAFHTLRNIISCDTRTFLCLSITTSLSSGSLKQLLTRHRKCIAGKGFLGSITTSEFAQSYRGCMHLEVLLLLCLFYARGFFHVESQDSASEPPTRADILGNCRVQLESIELLTLICSELIEIVKGMGKGLACYLADLMARCKLQKVILHCLNSSVNTYGHYYHGATIAEQIINFNNPHDDNLHAEALQIQLLRLLMVVIKLEHEVIILKNDLNTTSNDQADSGSISPTRLSSGETQLTAVKYLPNCVISQQPMFLSAVLSALQDDRLQALHHNWTDLVTSSLNCFKFGSLTNIVISVVHQLCNNIDQLTKMKNDEHKVLPPDYVISQLEAITVLCHYCLLDNTQQTTLSQLFNQAYPQTSSIASQNSNTGQLFNSIVHSLLPGGPSGNSAINQADSQAPKNSQLLAARNAVLSHLPRIVSSVAAIWDSDLGQIRQIKQQLMEFLSPISLHHGSNFLAAIAVTWQERGELHRKKTANESKNLTVPQQYQRNSMPQACTEQLSLVSLVSSIRVMPMDSFVQTLHQVVKTPPPIHRPPSNLKIEVSALELFYFYMRSAPAPQLGDSWTSLLALLRDGLSLTPPAQFTILMLLNEFVQRCPQMPFQDKKDIRDLHDVTSRLVDSLSNVAGSCLEQTTWLRRNLAVKEDITPMVTDNTTSSSSGGTAAIQKYSVQAQSVLAAILANLLDVAYGSQEKDKVVSIITTLLYNITPYLKNHTTRNIPSFYACSSLLASLSGYQYTRKAWRKDMMDLLLDTSFFQMDITCLPLWKQIMDSLMTYDNTTFRELMSRVSLTQTGSLNIFASREQEYEQRSMLLKRLAFVIFCSEFDQYHKYMPEIQEQLANSLRLLSNVPSVQAAVFLCFRVLLLRMSPDHVTSLWPIIIAEMVQVFLAMEQELKSDGEDLSQHIRMVSGMDTSWSSSAAGNGITSHSQLFYWRSVQLEASKLLEMGCVLPATLLPHFQMYRWAFVGTEFDNSDKIVPNGLVNDENLGQTALYVPHIRRIARLMDMKYTVHSPTSNIKRGKYLTLTCQAINTLQDLYSFFSTLSVTCPNPQNYADVDHEVSNCLQEIEEILSKDFLEKMSTSTSTPR